MAPLHQADEWDGPSRRNDAEDGIEINYPPNDEEEEEAGSVVELPPRSTSSSSSGGGRKKAIVVAVFSLVLVATIALGVGLSVGRREAPLLLEEQSIVAMTNDATVEEEEIDIINDQFFAGGEFVDEWDDELSQREYYPEDGDEDEEVYLNPNFSHQQDQPQEKFPIDPSTDDGTIAEFVGPVSDFVTFVGDLPLPNDVGRLRQASTSCPADEGFWNMELTTDNYPWETSYTVKDATSGAIIMAGPPSGRNYARLTKYVGSLCVPIGKYILELNDKGKDGICCTYGNGSMVVKVNDKTVAKTSDSDFSTFKRFVTVQRSSGTTPTPPPVKSPTKKPSRKPRVNMPSPAISPAELIPVDIIVKTDSYGKETGYKFARISTGKVLVNKPQGSLGNTAIYENNLLLEEDYYQLTLTDKFNGLENGGYFSVSVNGEEVVFGDKWNTANKPKLEYTIAVGYSPTLSARDRQWLKAHNTRRKEYHEKGGTTYRPLVWSTELAEAASDWVDEVSPTCQIIREQGIVEGENMSTRKSNVAKNESPEILLTRWVDKPLAAGKSYPENSSMTQALWRGTRYVGCKDKLTFLSSTLRCYVSICRYARAGNCAMGQYKGDWKEGVLADRTRCGPACAKDEDGNEICY
jgi:hypothetical protein